MRMRSDLYEKMTAQLYHTASLPIRGLSEVTEMMEEAEIWSETAKWSHLGKKKRYLD